MFPQLWGYSMSKIFRENLVLKENFGPARQADMNKSSPGLSSV